MLIGKQKFISLVCLTVSLLITYYLTIMQVQPSNEYLGMEPIQYGLFFSITILIYFLAWWWLFPKENETPSSIFIIIYFLFSFVWFNFFYSISGYTSELNYAVNLLVVMTPVFMLIICKNHFAKLYFIMDKSFIYKVSLGNMEFILVLILCVVTALMYQKMGISFSFEDSYVRRLAAREDIQGGLKYLFPASLNSIAPLLAFQGVLRKKYHYFMIGLFFAILGFGFIGTKAPIGFVLLLGGLGGYIRFRLGLVSSLITRVIFIFVVLSLVEYFIFGFSWLADIVMRRAFLVPPQIQSYFIEYYLSNGTLVEWIIGFSREVPITFIIGEEYFNNPETNANTTAFLYEIGRNGLIGYIIAVLFIVSFYSFLDFMYKKTNHAIWIGISFIYSILIIEQAYTTTFVTSGVGLIVFLALITNYQGSKKYK